MFDRLKIIGAITLIIGFSTLSFKQAYADSVTLKTIQETISPVAVAVNEEYKAIVKLNSFVLNEDFDLILNSFGSGILINDTGLVLTNNHVISMENSLDNSAVYMGYQVCLTIDFLGWIFPNLVFL